MRACIEQWALYISGVRSSGHQVKPNMAANGGPNLRQSQSPYAVFHVYAYSKNSELNVDNWNDNCEAKSEAKSQAFTRFAGRFQSHA